MILKLTNLNVILNIKEKTMTTIVSMNENSFLSMMEHSERFNVLKF